MKINRRRFLATSAVSGSLLLSSCKTADSSSKSDQGTTRLLVRKRWHPEQDDDIKAKYIQAIDWLKANDKETFEETDPRSYLTYSTIVKAHQNSCKHGDWFIFPWHRLFIQYFENACRYALQDASFALPYWDWTLDRRIPEEFFHNPILMADRRMKEEDEIPEEFVAQKVIDDILASDNFTNVHSRPPPLPGIHMHAGLNLGAFERAPHNGVHNSIGGIMSDPFDSPNDPVFWLHHCNIDRIWAMWQQRHPENLLPYTLNDDKTVTLKPAGQGSEAAQATKSRLLPGSIPWEDNVLELRTVRIASKDPTQKGYLKTLPNSDFNRPVAGSATISSILHISALGYTYDTAPKPLLQVSKKLVLKRYPRKETNIEGLREIAGDHLRSSISWTSKESAELLAQFKGRNDGYASLVATDLLGPADAILKTQMILRFFIVNGKTGTIKPEFSGKSVLNLPEYIGVHSFFGHSDPDRTSGDTTTAIDITRWLKSLLAKETVTDLQLIALALNPKDDYKPVNLFASDSTANMKIEFEFVDI